MLLTEHTYYLSYKYIKFSTIINGFSSLSFKKYLNYVGNIFRTPRIAIDFIRCDFMYFITVPIILKYLYILSVFYYKYLSRGRSKNEVKNNEIILLVSCQGK